MVKENEIVIFETKDKSIALPVSVEKDTVWLSANQMAALFDRDEKTIRKHINNIFSEDELEKTINTQKMRVDGVKQSVPFYTLDVIISVGYRVKSKRGVEFRQWANSVLKEYIIKGHAVNHNRMNQLNEVMIPSREALEQFIKVLTEMTYIRHWKKKRQICYIL